MSAFHPAFPMKLYASKGKMAGSIGCIAFMLLFSAATSISMLTDLSAVQTPRQWFWLICLTAFVPFMIWVLVIAVRKTMDKRPVIEVDERGITTSWNDYGLIAWNDILGVHVVQHQVSATTKVTYLLVVPKNPNELLKNWNEKTRKKAENALRQWRGLIIGLQALPFPPKEVGGAIQEYASQKIVENATPPPVSI